MTNISQRAYSLTLASPIRNAYVDETSCVNAIRNRLEDWNIAASHPMASVPQTYFCRLFVLDELPHQSLSAGDFGRTFYELMAIFFDRYREAALPHVDHLQSAYLITCISFHGDIDTYLRDMWHAIAPDIRAVWKHCYGFEQVHDASAFVAYIKKCQIHASLFFVGANDASLEEQLKALYLKQEFTKFAVEHQGLPAEELQHAYRLFIQRVQPTNLCAPSWQPGQTTLIADENP